VKLQYEDEDSPQRNFASQNIYSPQCHNDHGTHWHIQNIATPSFCDRYVISKNI